MKKYKQQLIKHCAYSPTTREEWRLIGKVLAISLLCGALVLGATLMPQEQKTPLATQLLVKLNENQSELSEADIAQYQSAFAALAHGNSSAAKEAILNLHNQRLVGYILAQLYTSQGYTASADELSLWLSAYGDHPQAAQIARLAAARGVKTATTTNEAPLKGNGYAEHLGRSTMPDSWYRGLSLWREQNYSSAQPLFVAIGNDKTLSGWQRAAGYYWAYRAAHQVSDSSAARANLVQSAQFKTTFYGLLAVQQLGARQADSRAPTVSGALRNSDRAIRASLLAQLGHMDEAENELRYLYSAVDKRERAGIITLSHELNLANLQVRLANLSDLSPEEEVFASYPVPQYVIDAQADQHASLMLAIARNESGFRETAASGAGAVGLMQMLPSTASSVERRVGLEALQVASNDNSALGPIAERLNDPATSVRYSAKYLDILAQQPAVGKNLVRVLAAYNAGPGNVAGWQSMAQRIEDPLLYIESIPYPETRNYVMQVMAHSWVYASLLGEPQTSLQQLSRGQWPALDKNI